MSAICELRQNLVDVILNPLLLLVFAVGFLLFVYGLVEFLWGINAGSADVGKQNGKRHMFYGVIGMFIMISAFTLVNVVINTVGGSVKDCEEN